jgi:hypothetical protein
VCKGNAQQDRNMGEENPGIFGQIFPKVSTRHLTFPTIQNGERTGDYAITGGPGCSNPKIEFAFLGAFIFYHCSVVRLVGVCVF